MARRKETKVRARTLQILYAVEVRDAPSPQSVVQEKHEWHEVSSYGAENFASKVIREQDALDSILAEQIDGWRLQRVGLVEKNILRLALFELLHTTTPPKVVIDEAIQLAHWFAGAKGPGFVNGVLDALARRYDRL